MISKSGNRFSEKIMLKRTNLARLGQARRAGLQKLIGFRGTFLTSIS